MLRRIYLIRHGDVDYFTPEGKPVSFLEATLNSYGIEQASALTELLEPISFQKHIHSGLLRTKQTLKIVLGNKSVNCIECTGFQEIKPAAILSHPDTGFEEWKSFFLNALGPGLSFNSRFMNGETFLDFTTRVNHALDNLLLDESWNNALVVAHSVVNRWILCRFLGMGLDGIASLEQDYGCMNIIDLYPNGLKLVRLMNYTPVDRAKVNLRKHTLQMLLDQAIKAKKTEKLKE